MIDNKLKEIGGRASDARKVVEYLYTQPIVDAQRVSSITGKSLKSTYSLLVLLEELEIVKEITGAQRGKLYMFEDYVNLFKK